MSFYEKGSVRIRYEEAGSGFPLLLIAGGGLNASISFFTQGSPFNAIEEFKGSLPGPRARGSRSIPRRTSPRSGRRMAAASRFNPTVVVEATCIKRRPAARAATRSSSSRRNKKRRREPETRTSAHSVRSGFLQMKNRISGLLMETGVSHNELTMLLLSLTEQFGRGVSTATRA
jgi:hypothetical protein